MFVILGRDVPTVRKLGIMPFEDPNLHISSDEERFFIIQTADQYINNNLK